MYDWLSGMLQSYMESRGQKYEFCYYTSGKEFLEVAEEFQLVFLDVEMPEMDGFLVAEELRRRKLEIEIIYLTSHEEMARKAFYVKALRYLPKTCSNEEWEEAMEAALHELLRNWVVKIETISRTTSFQDIRQIQYMESLGFLIY